MSRKTISIIICLSFLVSQTGFAQAAAVELNLAGHLARMQSSLVTPAAFRPIHLRYFSYDTLNNTFKVLIDKGDAFKASVIASSSSSVIASPTTSVIASPKEERSLPAGRQAISLESETKQLLNYFLIGLTLPNDSFWVNLRPDSPDSIIDERLAQTDIGKIMLEADLQLKKDTSAATSPQTPEGKEYWDKLYKKASELYGLDNVTIPTLTRPWIVPGEIIVRETVSSRDNETTSKRVNEPSAYIYKATLKVMLEADYLKEKPQGAVIANPSASVIASPGRGEAIQKTEPSPFSTDSRLKALNEYSTQLIRELIIPKLTREVNTSKRYAQLRQVYYSLILSRWFKSRFSSSSVIASPSAFVITSPQKAGEAISNFIDLIDSQSLTNLTSKTSWNKDTYFQAYKKSFTEGEYNLKEPRYTPTGQVIRSYMSGGVNVAENALTFAMLKGENPIGVVPTGSSALNIKDLGRIGQELYTGTAGDISGLSRIGQPLSQDPSVPEKAVAGSPIDTQVGKLLKEVILYGHQVNVPLVTILNITRLDIWPFEDLQMKFKQGSINAQETISELKILLNEKFGFLLKLKEHDYELQSDKVEMRGVVNSYKKFMEAVNSLEENLIQHVEAAQAGSPVDSVGRKTPDVGRKENSSLAALTAREKERVYRAAQEAFLLLKADFEKKGLTDRKLDSKWGVSVLGASENLRFATEIRREIRKRLFTEERLIKEALELFEERGVGFFDGSTATFLMKEARPIEERSAASPLLQAFASAFKEEAIETNPVKISLREVLLEAIKSGQVRSRKVSGATVKFGGRSFKLIQIPSAHERSFSFRVDMVTSDNYWTLLRMYFDKYNPNIAEVSFVLDQRFVEELIRREFSTVKESAIALVNGIKEALSSSASHSKEKTGSGSAVKISSSSSISYEELQSELFGMIDEARDNAIALKATFRVTLDGEWTETFTLSEGTDAAVEVVLDKIKNLKGAKQLRYKLVNGIDLDRSYSGNDLLIIASFAVEAAPKSGSPAQISIIIQKINDAALIWEEAVSREEKYRRYTLRHSTYGFYGKPYPGIKEAVKILDTELKGKGDEEKIDLLIRWLRNEIMALGEIASEEKETNSAFFTPKIEAAFGSATGIFRELLGSLTEPKALTGKTTDAPPQSASPVKQDVAFLTERTFSEEEAVQAALSFVQEWTNIFNRDFYEKDFKRMLLNKYNKRSDKELFVKAILKYIAIESYGTGMYGSFDDNVATRPVLTKVAQKYLAKLQMPQVSEGKGAGSPGGASSAVEAERIIKEVTGNMALNGYSSQEAEVVKEWLRGAFAIFPEPEMIGAIARLIYFNKGVTDASKGGNINIEIRRTLEESDLPDEIREFIGKNKEAIVKQIEEFEQAIQNTPTTATVSDPIPGEREKYPIPNSDRIAMIADFIMDAAGTEDISAGGTSSPAAQDLNPGGISFRPQDMVIKYQPMGSLQGLNFKLPTLSYNDLQKMNLAFEAKQIRQMIANGMAPSGERIKEFLSACCQKQQLSDYQGEVAVWLVEICRLEEQQVRESTAELKEAIVILENIAA